MVKPKSRGDLTGSHTEIEVSATRLKAKLPSAQASAIGHQLTNLISPLVESLGLVGDYIRFFRQRATIRAIKRVRDLADENDVPLTPIEPKFLIPWVEAVSLEEDNVDSPLTDMWARLLLNRSVRSNSARPIFIDVLKKMENPEAIALLDIGSKAFSNPNPFQSHAYHNAINSFHIRLIENDIVHAIKRFDSLPSEQDSGTFVNELGNIFEPFVTKHRDEGITIFDIGSAITFKSTRASVPVHQPDMFGRNADYDRLVPYTLLALQILEVKEETFASSGVFDFANIFEVNPKMLQTRREVLREPRFDVTVKYWCLSEFGAEFYRACSGLLSDGAKNTARMTAKRER